MLPVFWKSLVPSVAKIYEPDQIIQKLKTAGRYYTKMTVNRATIKTMIVISTLLHGTLSVVSLEEVQLETSGGRGISLLNDSVH